MTLSTRSETATPENGWWHQTACILSECDFGIEVRLGGDGRTPPRAGVIRWHSGDVAATTCAANGVSVQA